MDPWKTYPIFEAARALLEAYQAAHPDVDQDAIAEVRKALGLGGLGMSARDLGPGKWALIDDATDRPVVSIDVSGWLTDRPA